MLQADEAELKTAHYIQAHLLPNELPNETTAAYEDRQFALQHGDCLLLTTDGVTEAADEHEQEFGNEGVIASARASRMLGSPGIRSSILADVTQFSKGNFYDDASLIVVTVDS